MVLDKILAQHAHYAYGHSHHSEQETHLLDDLFAWGNEPRVHYVYVGHGKGRYSERSRGQFDYVGPHRGDFEKELLPPDHTCRHVGICVCLIIVAMVIAVVVHALLQDPPFDCHEGLREWERGWSVLKKEWCCENDNIACPGQPGVPATPIPSYEEEEGPVVPAWLNRWLSDMAIGSKFIMTMVLALIFGCGCGAFAFYVLVRYCISPRQSKTELELVAEVNQLLEKAGAQTAGEMIVTLMWDTKEDLDLHLVLPDKAGEISAHTPELCGGRLDVDANGSPLKATKTPIENIVFPFDSEPPEGDYEIWVKIGKHVLHADAHLTVIKTIRGKREIFHHRMVPGTFEKRITTFSYRKGP